MADPRSDVQERTEEATPRALEKAREQGNVARSTQLLGAVQLCVVAAFLLALGGQWAGQGRALVIEGTGRLSQWARPDLSMGDALSLLHSLVPVGSKLLLGPMAAVFLVSLGLAIWQTGGLRFSPEAAAPRPDRVLPSTGFRRIVSLRALARTGGALARLLVIVLLVVGLLSLWLPDVGQMSMLPLESGARRWSLLVVGILAAMALALLVLGLLDLVYQRWQWRRDLRMSRQQVKEEQKTTDGDPELKSRQARRRRQLLETSLEQAVAESTVVVTNPTHYSVALHYVEGEAAVPVVKAKGMDELAHEIRRLARARSVPVIEQPPLARALFRDVPVGKPIPERLYRAVADLLALVFRLREGRAPVGAGR